MDLGNYHDSIINIRYIHENITHTNIQILDFIDNIYKYNGQNEWMGETMKG